MYFHLKQHTSITNDLGLNVHFFESRNQKLLYLINAKTNIL